MRAESVNLPASNYQSRIKVIYGCIAVVMAIFLIRLFYIQVIRYDHYRQAALKSQLKHYEVPAERGTIYAHDGKNIVPLVLNEKKYTLFADPKFINDTSQKAEAIVKIIGGDSTKIKSLLETKDTRYVIIAKKLSREQSDKIAKLNFNGLGTREEQYRTYPEGGLAAQALGFVNDDGQGQYGIEEYSNQRLTGQPGQLRAITDARGVPLVANKSNLVIDPRAGDKLTLTLDLNMQRQVEQILKAGVERAESQSGSAVIINAKTGAIVAMANYPSYDPSKLQDIIDLSLLNNQAVSSPLEVGSIMKPLTTAAALSQGVINKNTSYYDPAKIKIDDALITNVAEDGGPQQRTIQDYLKFSLNTGAVYLLQQIGGGQINKQSRDTWNDYMVNRYGFSQKTGVEQAGELAGYVPNPDKGDGLNVVYANTAFGQGMTATMLQMAAAYAAIVNGGKYYQPHIIESITDNQGKQTKPAPKMVRQTVSAQVSRDMVDLLEGVVNSNHVLYGLNKLPEGYRIGGKTGSAQVAKPTGGYYEDQFIGTFAGFVGGDQPEYIIVDRVNNPRIKGFAGAASAAPIFSNLAMMLINNYGVTPKTN